MNIRRVQEFDKANSKYPIQIHLSNYHFSSKKGEVIYICALKLLHT